MADEPSTGAKPKLIIDEDWKRQAQAEKEALAKKAQEEQAAKAQGGAGGGAGAQPAAAPAAKAGATPEDQADDRGPLPPASLPMLFSTLATQALVSLGQIAHPLTGKAELDLEHARHQIDMLAVLQEKTRGNRTPDETQMLDDLLHDLRMTFVAMQEHLARQPAAGQK
jgi:hypothetical protein